MADPNEQLVEALRELLAAFRELTEFGGSSHSLKGTQVAKVMQPHLDRVAELLDELSTDTS